MKRRSFLAHLGTAAGVTLLAPWARQAFAAGGAPRRFVFVVEGNSYDPVAVMSNAARAAIDAQATNSTTGRRSFSRFYGHDSPLVVGAGDLGTAIALSPLLSGGSGLDLVSRSSVTLGLSSTVTGGGHTTNCGGLSSTRSTPGKPGGPTIDAVLAGIQDVRGETPFDVVRVGVHSSSGALNNNTCAVGAGRPVPVIMRPSMAYANLFGSVADEAGKAAFQRRASLLSYARADVTATLKSFSGNSVERAKLEAYLESVEGLTLRQQQLTDLAPTLAGLVPEGPSTDPRYASEGTEDQDALEILQVQFGLVEAALLGGLTNVAVIASGTGGGFSLRYPSLGEIDRHNLHHDAEKQEDLVPIIQEVTRSHVQMIADLARRLASVPEEGGTMLDNTVIVFLSDNGERHHSEAFEFPVLMVGGQALGLKNDGRTTVFPGVHNDNNRQLSNLFNTLGYAAGLEMDDFGNEGTTRIAEGPLSELWG